MGNVLVIKGSDFSVNAIETIAPPQPSMEWEDYDFQGIDENSYVLSVNSQKWVNLEDAVGEWIPVVAGRNYRIILSNETNSGFAWFSQKETPVNNSVPVNKIGDIIGLYSTDNPNEVTAPLGATYLYVNKSYAGAPILSKIQQYV